MAKEDDQYDDQTMMMMDDDENNEKPYQPRKERRILPATKIIKLPTYMHTHTHTPFLTPIETSTYKKSYYFRLVVLVAGKAYSFSQAATGPHFGPTRCTHHTHAPTHIHTWLVQETAKVTDKAFHCFRIKISIVLGYWFSWRIRHTHAHTTPRTPHTHTHTYTRHTPHTTHTTHAHHTP